MGRKQKRHQLRERYMTDIFSRWKEGAYIHDINDKLEEHMRLAELTDDEHAEFVQSFHDRIYTYLIEEYQAHIRHKRATTHHLYWNVARDVVYPSIQMRLKKTLKEWIRTENNTIYDTIVDTYVRLRCHGASLEELVARVPADTDRRTVQTRLYALIEGWQAFRDRVCPRKRRSLRQRGSWMRFTWILPIDDHGWKHSDTEYIQDTL